MSNRMIIQSGGGRRPDLRSLRIGRGSFLLWLMVGLLASASSALAAEIVEVRVGRHAEFTRVVFELDRAAGYRIERADPGSTTSPDRAVSELVVSLDASTIPRRVESAKSLIDHVAVEPSGSRSVARIRLAKDGLRLKEMILANPPRIVLDVFSDQPVAAKVAKAAIPKKPAKATPTKVETPKAAARTAAASASGSDAGTKREAVPSLDEPTFDQIVAQIPVDNAPADSPEAVKVAEADVPKADAPSADETAAKVAVVDEPTVSTPLDESPSAGTALPLAAQTLDQAEPAAPAVEKPAAAKKTPRPMVVRTKPAKDEGGGWMTWALMGGGGILLLAGGLLVARRMAGGEEADYADDDADFDLGAGEGAAGTEENPFGGTEGQGAQMTLGASDDPGSATTALLSDDEEKESESVVFGDSEENNMEDMEVISREQVNESLGAMPAASGAVPAEFQQMMREMSLRVESLEGRIDELVDARDRLERQVAAQTEELRVQRAAIARTQRAVRNLARPEDEEGDQEPTEPAFRDPNMPTSSE